MKKLVSSSILATVLLGFMTYGALAATKTITLAVDKMYCSACPHIVKESLLAVPGVDKVEVSFENKTAVVTFDDGKANLDALTAATTKAGYPSHVAQ